MVERQQQFGQTTDVQNKLAALVVAGRKRGTSALARWYGESEPWPHAGEVWSVADGQGATCCRCRTLRVDVRPFGEVDAVFAAIEGEEDGSLERWREIHREFFAAEATAGGFVFDDTTPIVLVEFEVLASTGWDESAQAWLDEMGDAGDFGRRFVLDAPMLARIRGYGYQTALDVGCGEGRFCRMLAAEGIATIGIDPTQALIAAARQRDPGGDYRLTTVEHLDVPDGSFDLVVSYLSLIDIPDLTAAIGTMVRALRPGGTLLVANLTSFNSAGPASGWTTADDGVRRFYIDDYLEERAMWVSWRAMRIQNWHRPLSTYMKLFLNHGLTLTYFDEPAPSGGDPVRAEHYRRVPYFHIMEWRKPA